MEVSTAWVADCLQANLTDLKACVTRAQHLILEDFNDNADKHGCYAAEPGIITDELGEHLPIRFFCHPSIPSNATASIYGVTLSTWGGMQSLAFDAADTLYGPARNPDAIPPVDSENHEIRLPLFVQPVTAAGSSRKLGHVNAVDSGSRHVYHVRLYVSVVRC